MTAKTRAARREIVHPFADRFDDAAHFEAGGDRPTDVLFGRRVEPHAHDAIGIVDADGFGANDDLAGKRARIVVRFEDEAVVSAGSVDDDFPHGRAG